MSRVKWQHVTFDWYQSNVTRPNLYITGETQVAGTPWIKDTIEIASLQRTLSKAPKVDSSIFIILFHLWRVDNLSTVDKILGPNVYFMKNSLVFVHAIFLLDCVFILWGACFCLLQLAVSKNMRTKAHYQKETWNQLDSSSSLRTDWKVTPQTYVHILGTLQCQIVV